MNTPLGTVPPPIPPDLKDAASTPQASPTAWGIGQSLLTGFLTFKGSTALGLPPQYAGILAAGVASGITSGLHALAQKWHLDGK